MIFVKIIHIIFFVSNVFAKKKKFKLLNNSHLRYIISIIFRIYLIKKVASLRSLLVVIILIIPSIGLHSLICDIHITSIFI